MPKSAYATLAAVMALSGCATPHTSAPSGTTSVSHNNDPIVRDMLAQAAAAQQEWLNGNSQPAAGHMAHSPTFTIFSPFGGPSPPGWTEEFAKGQAGAASQFQGGTTDIELVQSYVSENLIVLVTIERNQVRFAGREGLRRWDLRVTQVFQGDGKNWKVVHRHADPLVMRRDLRQTLELMPR
jgi:hypothetical protein